MRKMKWLVSAGFALLLWGACRKTDQPSTAGSSDFLEQRFFKQHSPDDPRVQAVARFVQGENERKQFLPILTSRIGFPRWDKALVVQSASGASRQQSGDSSVVYIPFVRDSQNYVNASLVVKMTPADTSFRIIRDNQYSSFGFDTASNTAQWHALDVFTIFATLDRSVFGPRDFQILDGRILGGEQSFHPVAHLEESQSGFQYKQGRGNYFTVISICYIITYSEVKSRLLNSNHFSRLEASSGGLLHCTLTYIETNDPNSGGGSWNTDPAGGGGGTGWIPTGDGTGPSQPIDTILARYSRFFRPLGDSIYTHLSQPSNIEYFFAGTKFPNSDSMAIMNIKTDFDSIQVYPNLVIGSQVLLFIWHSHVSTSMDPADRRCFSTDDINFLRSPACLKQNFVSFADCHGKLYALVITDVAKAQAFFSVNNLSMMDTKYSTTGGGTMQDVDERCVKAVIGSASANGISLYKSTDSPNFVNWTLINP